MMLAFGGIVGSGVAVHAASSGNTQSATFISEYKGDVQKASSKYKLYGSVMMAQAALESAWGQSQLTKQANNFFGIKGAFNGQSVSMPTTEYDQNGQIQNVTANFKKYPTAYDSFADNGSTLRNGTSWNPSYYSGSWKENASTYQDAANALTGKYATAPNYGTALISLIQQYNLDQVFNEDGSGSNSASTPGSSSSSSNSSSTNNNDSDTELLETTQPNVAEDSKPLAKVKYTKGDPNQLVQLSATFNKYYAYNHVKGANKNEKKYKFRSLGITKPVWVYVDMKGTKSGSNTQWYRIRFYKNAKSQKFWVYAPTLNFPQAFYSKSSGSVTVNTKSKANIYNHVYGTDQLSKSVSKASSLNSNFKYPVDGEAIKDNGSNGELWYRIKFNGKRGWIKSTSINSYTPKTVYVKLKATKKLLSSAKNGYAYNRVPTNSGAKKSTLKSLGITSKTKLTSNMVGYTTGYTDIWYRIVAPKNGKQYWVLGSMLN